MNRQTPYARHRQLREVAILMASLDDAMAQRLLDSMPIKDATAVMAEVEELDSIDPEEQNEVVEKFCSSVAPKPTREVDGVELDASLLAKLEAPHLEEDYSSTKKSPQKPLETLSESGASAIIEMLSSEHPQTIAMVLSRIDACKAAELMSKLSLSLQADVLARMGNLDATDEQAEQVIEQQLANWIEQQRQREHRQAAGTELVQRILEHTPEAQRQTILAHMGRNSPTKIEPTTTKAKQSPVTTITSQPAIGISRSKSKASFQAAIVKQPSRREVPMPDLTPVQTIELVADPLTELEKTEDSTLMAALSQTDRQVGALALAGASDVLMKRVLRSLPRRQANTMRRQLRSIGPTRLSDMLTAQQQLLQSVRQLATR